MNSLSRIRIAALAGISTLVAVAIMACGGSAEHATAPASQPAAPASGSSASSGSTGTASTA